MVPKESAFNQSVAASGTCARKARRFPGSSATMRDGKLLQMPSRRNNSPSKLKLRNNQTVRNVYMWMQHFFWN